MPSGYREYGYVDSAVSITVWLHALDICSDTNNDKEKQRFQHIGKRVTQVYQAVKICERTHCQRRQQRAFV